MKVMKACLLLAGFSQLFMLEQLAVGRCGRLYDNLFSLTVFNKIFIDTSRVPVEGKSSVCLIWIG